MGFQQSLMTGVNTTVAYLALAWAASCYGLWHILANVAMSSGAPPMIFALYRCAGGMGCCLLALICCPQLGTKSRQTKGQSIYGDAIVEFNHYSRKDELMFLMLGICMAGNFGGFVLASSMLPALTCSIFAPLIPVVTALISIAWGREEKNEIKLMGLFLAVLGALVVVIFEDSAMAPPENGIPRGMPTGFSPYEPVEDMKKPIASLANTTVKALANGTVATAVGNATMAVANATNATKAVAIATNASAANATAVAAKAAVAAAAVVPNKTSTVVRAAAPVVAKAVKISGIDVQDSEEWKVLGYLCLFLCTFSAAMYFVLLKDVLKTYTPVRATALAYSHATGLLFIGCVARHGLDPWAWFLYGDMLAWICLIYAACVTTGFTYTIQAWACGMTSPSTVTAFTTLSPISAALISAVFLDIHLRTFQIVGGAMIMIGLWINITVQARENGVKEKVPLMKPSEYGASPYDSARAYSATS